MKSVSYKKALLGVGLMTALAVIYPLWVKATGSAPPASPVLPELKPPPYPLELHFAALPHYRITHWAEPQRIYVDLDDTPMTAGIALPAGSESLIAGISFPPAKGQDKRRVQIDFKAPIRFKSRMQRVGEQAHLILDIDLQTASPVAAKPLNPEPAPTPVKRTVLPVVVTPAPSVAVSDPPAVPAQPQKPALDRNRRHWVIAIDAGHGGKDTGALGPTGLMEKDVVLAIARRLADFVRAETDMKAVMIRNGDQFVDLRQRVSTARDAKADLFLSLHADAYINDQAKGSSVFTLSDHGATSEAARWLADRENAALVGGVKLNGGDSTLASVLLDLSQNATLDASDRIASKILRELKKGFLVHHQEIQKAGFVVLKSPDIPSLLIETAFISNPEEELNLISPQHQTQIAKAVFKGIRASFAPIRQSNSRYVIEPRAER
ncbi:MAG: N-acetylmuramoyl-L-alanine amidase family protein [Methylococcaceae bacterium]